MVRIAAFWAKGYRSLRDVRLDDLDRPFNVFYGKNGSGKSNILAGIQAVFDLAAHWARYANTVDDVTGRPETWTTDERCKLGDTRETQLGVTLVASENEGPIFSRTSGKAVYRLEFAVFFDWLTGQTSLGPLLRGPFQFDLRDDAKAQATWPSPDPPPAFDEIRHLLRERLPRHAYTLVTADRFPHLEEDSLSAAKSVLELVHAGKLYEALYRAQAAPDPAVRMRLKRLRTLLEGKPLERPQFDIVCDPKTKKIDLREPFRGQPSALGEVSDISVRMAGLGIAQIYSLLAQLLLPGTRIAGIEEPEANLHAPDTGRDLRVLLERVVDEGILDQLFISTHSNLFDLDDTGYHEVTYDPELGTQVKRSPLHEVDKHFYEPGPALRALREFASYMGDEDVGLRGPDGSVITTSELIDRLRRDDDAAVEFLREMHAAAVRMTMLKGRKKPAGS